MPTLNRKSIEDGLAEYAEYLRDVEDAEQASYDCQCCCCTGECYNDSYSGEFPY